MSYSGRVSSPITQVERLPLRGRWPLLRVLCTARASAVAAAREEHVSQIARAMNHGDDLQELLAVNAIDDATAVEEALGWPRTRANIDRIKLKQRKGVGMSEVTCAEVVESPISIMKVLQAVRRGY